MGIETWALLALVAVLAVYLLPFLVGRREAMSMANAEDRYSSGLRLLATGSAAVSGEGCGGGHAMIFRRRPEVRAMNRPEVRNVRALRKERELVRLRQAHERARERRRVAASHRATVALILLGVTAGTVVVAAVSVMPWWVVAIPGALLGGSALAGRRAARASAASDRRERRRIAALERELTALTGSSAASRLLADASVKADEQAQPRHDAEAPAQETAAQATDARETAVQETEAAAVASDAVERDEPTVAAGVQEGSEPGDKATPAEASTEEPTAPPEVVDAETRGDQREAKAPATPPQGWHPVSVPAPTYTLAARAPRRSYEPPAEEPFDSAPVPERPRSAHAYPIADPEVGADEPVFHPIDLEAVLERRRAGA
ncbi:MULTISPECIES: hypothetical protein [unclassified Actinomyces]|uniref:hypothetical protein n=1 Tax=unclassified Actinomyces TaxID=2609248 RepID=UPI000D592C18|nr:MULTISPECIES: hypothetical protein [unclassified Actinomyces]RAX19038.1 hypothetical protein DRB07_15010 [Actinomyces sp. Z3]